jgi:hypothetical protein
LNLYVQKPCEAIQLKKENIQKIMEFFPEEKFVFYGIEQINGVDQKIFDDDLSSFSKVGGFFYHKKEVKVIVESEWIIKRKDIFEIVNDEYFKNNFVQIPFIEIHDEIVKKEENNVDSG